MLKVAIRVVAMKGSTYLNVQIQRDKIVPKDKTIKTQRENYKE